MLASLNEARKLVKRSHFSSTATSDSIPRTASLFLVCVGVVDTVALSIQENKKTNQVVMVKRSKGEGKAAKVVSTTVGPISISSEDGKEHAVITYPALQWSSDSSSYSSGNSGSFEDEAAKVREAFRQRSLLDEKERAENDRFRAESPIIPVMRNASRDLFKSVAALHIAQEQLENTMTLSHQLRSHKNSSDPEARTSVSSPGGRNFTLRERFQRLSRLQRKKLLLKADREHASSFLLFEEDNDDNDDHDDIVETCSSRASAASEDLCPRDHHQQQHQQQLNQRPYSRAASCPSDDDSQALRHQRQANYKSMDTVQLRRKTNSIKLHVYDLIAKDTLMMLPPFGCIVEIGKCFNEVNSALHQLGTGAYHVGIEINGIEYAYGATSTPGKTGIFSCIPTLSPGYQYRQTIDLGERPLVRRTWIAVPRQVPFRGYSSHVYREVEEYIDGRQVIKEMTRDYMGADYDILRKNCCSFARDACIRLGVTPDEIPSWFRNLAETGATTQDMAIATVQPLTSVLSACEDEGQQYQIDQEFGFEMIARQNAEGTKSIVVVVDSRPQRRSSSQGQISLYDLRRNATWTY